MIGRAVAARMLRIHRNTVFAEDDSHRRVAENITKKHAGTPAIGWVMSAAMAKIEGAMRSRKRSMDFGMLTIVNIVKRYARDCGVVEMKLLRVMRRMEIPIGSFRAAIVSVSAAISGTRRESRKKIGIPPRMFPKSSSAYSPM